MNTEDTHLHAGHRQRLKGKVQKFGLECLSEHEILELLLTYTIPRKNTNPIAHDLLEKFGNIATVVDTSFYDLLKVEGVGKESALFFEILSQFIDVYHKNKFGTVVETINGTSSAVLYFRKHFLIRDAEEFHVLCLNKMKKVVSHFEFRGDEASVKVDLKFFVEKINGKNISSCVLFHTHPNGNIQPSPSDITATQAIFNVCCSLGILLEDHIILNEFNYYSFDKNGKMQVMYDNYNLLFKSTINNLLKKDDKPDCK